MRPLTLDERVRLALLAAQIRDGYDATLGELLSRVAAGDDDALLLAHDRLVDLGDARAERLRRLLPK